MSVPHPVSTQTAPTWSSRAPRRRLRTPLVALAAVGLLAACGDDGGSPQPLTTTQVAPLASANLHALASVWRADAAWALETDFTGDMLHGLPIVGGDAGNGGDPDKTFDARLDDLADKLAADVFIDANVVSDDGRTIVYELPFDVICWDPGTRAECEARWADEHLRLAVSSRAEGELTIVLRAGEPAVEPMSFTLGRERASASISLAPLYSLLERNGALEADDNGLVLNQMLGRVTFTFARDDDHTATASAAVDEAVSLRASGEGATVNASLGRSTASATFDAAARTVDLDVDAGAFRLDGPLRLLGGDAFEDVALARMVAIDVPGVDVEVDVDDAARTLDIDDLSLGNGPTTIKLDGQTLLALDLNRNADREVDLHVSRLADGGNEIVVSPSLELRLTLALAQLTAIEPDFDAGWAADETLTVTLDGSTAPTVRTHGDTTEVIAGRLTYASSAAPALGFTVEAGQCLVDDGDDGDDDEHPFASFAVTDCSR